ncbi:MAG TPA: type I DNA topoisomerase [Candidatus Fimadaptatus faecigallinarum]|uniref:DNA topoisomerase 1 n=1 Tax=Candidatus Fimadaptatus faecigallinarum TaxID=2840814 RepID=A0A9D1S456_9FIRM|nr:type I DNA topoisomerase [Candidatus Fimadaptatus faecigallinarum]
MTNKLVIVESPAKARTIGKFLGRGYKVEASNGHVRDLPKSQMGVDVDNNFEPRYITIRGRGEILDRIRKDARTASKIYLATDPDREGEAISWHLAYVLGIKEDEACRVEFHEITSKAVKAAMKVARPINMNLVNAQQARRVLDRLVGYKISPLLWQKVKKGLSAGRVQSVATRMICDREREIDEFVPEEYWVLTGRFSCAGVELGARLVTLGGEQEHITSREQAESALELIRAQSYTVSAVRKGEKRKNPAAPFTTSNMQQEASRKLGFTTQKTMQIAQQLYEGVDLEGEGTQGLISYIRTDSTRVSDEAIAAVRGLIGERYGAEYLPETPNVYRSRKTAQDAHEAIRPTDMTRTPDSIKESLTRDQFKLYKLIYSRFVSSQMTPAVYDTLSVDLSGGPVVMRFTGTRKKFAGFTVVYEESLDDEVEEKDTRLPDITEGMALELKDAAADQRFTQPPPRYTEASLVRELEEKGIGRPSTYAPTITTIIARGYISRENKRLVPTELGLIVTDLMKQYFSNIVDLTFTANMEEELDEVEEGELDWHKVISDFYGPFEKTLENAEKSMEKVQIVDQVSDVVCDKCGALMVYKMGRYGKFLACPNFPECRNTKALLKEIDAPCPKCGGKLLERMSHKGRKFYGCEHYPECDFVSWDMPVREKCPVCGSMMVLKRGRKGAMAHVCTNETCRHRVELTPQEGDED